MNSNKTFKSKPGGSEDFQRIFERKCKFFRVWLCKKNIKCKCVDHCFLWINVSIDCPWRGKKLLGFVTDWLEIYWDDQSQRRLSIPLPSMRFINKIYFPCQTDTDLISNDKMFALLSCNGKYMKNYINCEDLCKSSKWCIIASKANFPTQITEHTVIGAY